jgi:hypothetical protein
MTKAMTDKDHAIRIACQVADEFTADETLWTVGTLARDKDGNPVSFGSDKALQFCATGRALHHISRSVPEARRSSVFQYFNAIACLARDGIPGRDIDIVAQTAPSDEVVRANDELWQLPKYPNSPDFSKDNLDEQRIRGARKIAAFLRKGVELAGSDEDRSHSH